MTLVYTLGEKKVALYAVIPDNDNTFNFLVSLLYAQAFQALYYSADQIHHGPLPRHVRFVLDEFAAMPLPGFTRELATMRSRSISASVIIQNMAQTTVFAKHGRTAKTPSAQRVCGAESAKAHQLPDDAVAHLDRAHQHQHIEDQLAHIVPYDGGCRQRIVRDGGRGRGKGREDHTGQYDDTALHADGGIAFQKSNADTAGVFQEEFMLYF